jgi:hypothetical protein
MLTDLSRVQIHRGACACSAIATTRVHHRHFPEIWAEAGSAAEGADLLAGKLASALETTPSDWQRDVIVAAIDDVHELMAVLCAGDDRAPACEMNVSEERRTHRPRSAARHGGGRARASGPDYVSRRNRGSGGP